jgi:hypothetical protein
MQTEKEAGGEAIAEAKKKGAGMSVTIENVKEVAERLRRRLEGTQDVPVVAARVAEPVEFSEAVAGDVGPNPVMACSRRHVFNRHLLMCEIGGVPGWQPVVVRDSSHYRVGERFEVKKNDVGRWEAAVQRMAPRYQ